MDLEYDQNRGKLDGQLHQGEPLFSAPWTVPLLAHLYMPISNATDLMPMNAKRLLIVDDEAEFGEFVRRVAVDSGYEVMVTTNGLDFQKNFASFQPNKIILDMVIPDIDGNELLLWLLAQGYASDLIITTGFSPDYAKDAKTLAEFKGLPSVKVLVKPIRLAQLREALSA